ncbi:MAG: AbrB family transcriptional regulator [Kiloniellales bacterium]
MRRHVQLVPLLLALAIGSAGGFGAFLLELPLAWMIGAMAATTLAAVAGVRIAMPLPLRAVMVAVLGVMLGSAFTPAILGQLAEWSVSLTALVAYVAVAGVAGAFYFRLVASYDPVTAYFAAMPGGLSEMFLVGSAMGGDGRIISLIHASRILLVVMTLPFAFQLLLGYEPAARPPAGLPIAEVPLEDLLLLTGCGIAGYLAARLLRVPAAGIVGPMVLSAGVHLAGWPKAAPPLELIAAAQVVVGSAIGCRFSGSSLGFIRHTIVIAAGATAILLLITLSFAIALNAVTGLPTAALVLAFAPGGLAEMSLIALALALETAFVATHHIVRIFLIVVAAPFVFRLTRRRGNP